MRMTFTEMYGPLIGMLILFALFNFLMWTGLQYSPTEQLYEQLYEQQVMMLCAAHEGKDACPMR